MQEIKTSEVAIHLAKDSASIRLCYPVMHELRPHLICEKAFVAQTERQIMQGYHLVYLTENNQVKALAGYRYLEFLAWGKVLYIDDFACSATSRKNGFGSKILSWIVDEAKKAKCDQVHLDSGPHRHDAHRLYLKSRFKIVAHHFALDLSE